MTALEAIHSHAEGYNARRGVWCRPVSWRGAGQALVWDTASPNRGWKRVPSFRGGDLALMPTLPDMLGEWEVVSPDVVHGERP